MVFLRVRAKIRNGEPDFAVTADSWPAFIYAKEKVDPSNLEKGFLQSKLLVKVRAQFSIHQRSVDSFFVQAFRCIFTSPSSAKGDREDEDVNSGAQRSPPKKQRKIGGGIRKPVAELIGLKKVTPRSVAYTAVQVRFDPLFLLFP